MVTFKEDRCEKLSIKSFYHIGKYMGHIFRIDSKLQTKWINWFYENVSVFVLAFASVFVSVFASLFVSVFEFVFASLWLCLSEWQKWQQKDVARKQSGGSNPGAPP